MYNWNWLTSQWNQIYTEFKVFFYVNTNKNLAVRCLLQFVVNDLIVKLDRFLKREVRVHITYVGPWETFVRRFLFLLPLKLFRSSMWRTFKLKSEGLNGSKNKNRLTNVFQVISRYIRRAYAEVLSCLFLQKRPILTHSRGEKVARNSELSRCPKSFAHSWCSLIQHHSFIYAYVMLEIIYNSLYWLRYIICTSLFI